MHNDFTQMIDMVDDKLETIEREISEKKDDLNLLLACRSVLKASDKDEKFDSCIRPFWDTFNYNGDQSIIDNVTDKIKEMEDEKTTYQKLKEYIEHVASVNAIN